MNERIRRIRKEAGLTQTEFGARIGIKGNTITNYEKGLRTPSDAVIFSMCREFKVNEEWLRTGEGNPYKELTPSEEIENIVRNLLNYSKDSEKNPLYDMIIEMMKDYNELDPDSQAVIRNYCNKVQTGLTQNKETAEQDNTYPADRSYLRPVAAHERTDTEVTDEMRQTDDDIMNDDDFWK